MKKSFEASHGAWEATSRSPLPPPAFHSRACASSQTYDQPTTPTVRPAASAFEQMLVRAKPRFRRRTKPTDILLTGSKLRVAYLTLESFPLRASQPFARVDREPHPGIRLPQLQTELFCTSPLPRSSVSPFVSP